MFNDWKVDHCTGVPLCRLSSIDGNNSIICNGKHIDHEMSCYDSCTESLRWVLSCSYCIALK